MRLIHRTIPFPTDLTSPAAALWFEDFTTPIVGLSGGYGSSKTYTACAKALVLAHVNHGQPGKAGVTRSMATEPTHGTMKDAMIPTFEELLEKWGIPYELTGTNNGWNLWLPEVHHMILLRSAANPNNLKGKNLTHLVMDEAPVCSKDAWREASSRVRDPRAKCPQKLPVGTPDKMLGWFYELLATGDYKGTRLIYAPTEMNAQNLTQDYVSDMKEQYDPETYRIFAEGHFANAHHGSVFGDLFKRETHARDEVPIQPHLPLMWGMDFNVDPMVACAFQEIGGDPVIVDELVLRNTHTQEFAHQMKRLWPHDRYREQRIYCDIGGGARKTSAGGQTDISILREAGFKVEFRSVSDEADAINEVRGLLLNTHRRIRLRVSSKCRHVITALEAWAYEEGSMRTKEKEYARIPSLIHVPHMADAVKYLAHNRYPITRASARFLNRGA